jgi:phosphate transport system protein
MLQERIESLKRHLIAYASLVEGMILKSVQGLIRRERDALLAVIEIDEPRANAFEIELDEQCTNIVAQYEPKARDLRTVLMILKMNGDMERMADHAVNIAQNSLYLVERPIVKPLIDIPRMVEEVTSMVRDGIRSFIEEDARLAKAVCERDTTVDRLQDSIRKELVACMTNEPGTIERALELLSISNNLERIADLSTNIGEDVIFMVEGRVIKHWNEESGAGHDYSKIETD